MRLVFMGTPQFAAVQLEACHREHDVVEVYTRPDSASGRGSQMRPSAVKQTAESLGIPVRQPTTLRDADVQAHLREVAPDVIVVAAYGLILPREVLAIPRYGCLNVHASLLPRWRGAAPVQRAILAGDTVTGVSIMRMEEGLDTGPFAEVVRVEVDELTADELTAALAEAGARALVSTLAAVERGDVHWVEQDDSQATYADKIRRADVTPEPTDAVEIVLRKVRASSRQAPARVVVAGRGLTIVSARRCEGQPGGPAPGSAACTPDGLELGVGDGCVLVARLKPDGKAEMDAAAWARGARLGESEAWGPA